MAPDLTQDERLALEKPMSELDNRDPMVLRTAIEKLKEHEDSHEYYMAVFRFAVASERTTKPHDFKARCWESAGILAERQNKPCTKLYENAADHIARDGSPERAAILYEKAANHSITEHLEHTRIQNNYRRARQYYGISGRGEDAARLFLLERNYQLGVAEWQEKAWLFVFKIFSEYGESPMKVGRSALVVIFVCALMFWWTGLVCNSQNTVVHSFPTSLYFSFVTFTTLGYGDYSPPEGFARVAATLEALSGLLFVSFYLVTFVRKYGRS